MVHPTFSGDRAARRELLGAPSSRQGQRCPGRAGAPPLVPLLAADDDLTPEVDRALTNVAGAAKDGDAAALVVLHLALEAKIERFVARYAARDWARRGPRRDNRPWHVEDLRQDAFVVLTEMMAAWPAEGVTFGRYFLSVFPWRLRDAAERYARPWRREITGPWAQLRLLLLFDGSAEAEEALARLEAIAAGLRPPDDDLLRWRVRDGEPFVEIGRRLGVTPRTVGRRWARLLSTLRASLDEAEQAAPAKRRTAAATRRTARR